MSGVVEILIDQIDVSGRLRPASEPYVEALMASIARASEAGVGHDGLREPIEVRPLEDGIDGDGRGYALVAGLHRLEACRRLERDSIAATEYDIGRLEAELLEVEENLVRADLNALDRALFVKRFREMFEVAYGAIERGGDRKSAEFVAENQSRNVRVWSAEAMERLGISEDTARRALIIANNLAKASINRLRGTEWENNQKALLELSALDTKRQTAALQLLFEDGSGIETMRDAIAHLSGAPKADMPDADRWLLKVSTGFKQRPRKEQKRLVRELIAADPDLFREVFAEIGLVAPEANG